MSHAGTRTRSSNSSPGALRSRPSTPMGAGAKEGIPGTAPACPVGIRVKQAKPAEPSPWVPSQEVQIPDLDQLPSSAPNPIDLPMLAAGNLGAPLARHGSESGPALKPRAAVERHHASAGAFQAH
ncbi:hypothetical protein MRS44_007662 [Fusarium solani]|uniref:uncharacterized protein n=1 Tax=Fusarium solani TaxID=169388 RepID=UPI0032C43164|nr:hypothetical protein MRS44_007662 [Fusarium solani]